MDIDKQLGAISAEFWQQIGVQLVDEDIHHHNDDNSSSLLNPRESKIVEENSLTQQSFESHLEVSSEAPQIQQGGQTLGDMINETLMEGKKAQSSMLQQPGERERRRVASGIEDDQAAQLQGNSGRKKKLVNRKKWSEGERQRLFDLLGCFGTDFTTIQLYFEHKTVSQIKNKFSKEERADPAKIIDLMKVSKAGAGQEGRRSSQLGINVSSEVIQAHFEEKYGYANRNGIQAPTIKREDIGNSSVTQNNTAHVSEALKVTTQQPSLPFNPLLPPFKMVSEDIQRRLLKETALQIEPENKPIEEAGGEGTTVIQIDHLKK